jgi:cytochrome oxidase Cu insertion factor (SCO1/SenC/PrrC family)
VTSVVTGTRRAVIAGACAFLLSGSAVAEEWASTRSAGDLMDAVMWAKEPIGGSFSMVDHHGARRTNRDFLGRTLVVYFGYMSCPDICPTELLSISQAIQRLGPAGQAIQPIFITLDPDRDAPENMKEYLASIHPNLVGLTGSHDEIRKIAEAYRVYFARVANSGGDYSIDHMGFVYLVAADGRYFGFLPPGTSVERMTEVFKVALQSK